MENSSCPLRKGLEAMVDSSSKRFLVSDRGLMGKLGRSHAQCLQGKIGLPPKNPILADTCKSTSPTKGVRIEHAHTEYWLSDVLVVLHNDIFLCIVETAGFYLRRSSIIIDAFNVHLLPVSAFSSTISKRTTAQHACVARSKSVPAPRRIAPNRVGASRAVGSK